MSRVEIRGLCKEFHGRAGRVVALDHISLDVPSGEFLVLVGPSGCGKSTMLSILAGLEKGSHGTVLVDDEVIQGPHVKRAMVFQDGALFPWLSVRKNVEFPLRRMGVPKKERAERAMEILKMVQLEQFADSWIHELSGGMRQRVAIARAVVVEPEVLLMDEPFSALDAITREELYGELQRIWERLKTTIIFITHNTREAVTLGDRVALMCPRPGRIQRIFDINILRPRHIDDADVNAIAREISLEMKLGPHAEAPVETDDLEPPVPPIDLLRGFDRPVGGAG